MYKERKMSDWQKDRQKKLKSKAEMGRQLEMRAGVTGVNRQRWAAMAGEIETWKELIRKAEKNNLQNGQGKEEKTFWFFCL